MATLKVEPLHQKLARSRDSLLPWTERQGIMVTLSDQGHQGHGEASPLPNYSPDTLDEAWSELHAYTRQELPHFTSPQELWRWLETQDFKSPSARFALETAYLSAMANKIRVTLAHLLNPGIITRPVPLCKLLNGNPSEELVESFDSAFAQGAFHMKWKIGRPGKWPQEWHVIDQWRVFIPPISLRLDANQQLKAEHLDEVFEELNTIDLEWLEEPCPIALLETWRRIHPRTKVPPLALDESLHPPHHALSVMQNVQWLDCYRAVVLKPTVLGGIKACMDLAAEARKLGMQVTVSHTFESPIGYHACMGLARALKLTTSAGLGDDYLHAASDNSDGVH